MRNKRKFKSLIDREMENPKFRKLFEQEYEALKLEIQILTALERQELTYSDLAKALHTSKSNISRDLKGGGISTATLARVFKIAEAIGMRFIPLLVPKKKEKNILPKIQRLLAA